MVYSRYKGCSIKRKVVSVERNVKTPIIFKYSFLIPEKNYCFKSKKLGSFESKLQFSPVLLKSRKRSSFKEEFVFKLHPSNTKHILIQEENIINNNIKISNFEQKEFCLKSEGHLTDSSKNLIYKVNPEQIRKIYKKIKFSQTEEPKEEKGASEKFKKTILLYKNAINSFKLSKTNNKTTMLTHDSTNNFNIHYCSKNSSQHFYSDKNFPKIVEK
jgi:hypothetical protein